MKIKKCHIEDGYYDEGYWLNLKSGFCEIGNQGRHSIHEDTRRECLQIEIERCSCKDCNYDRENASPVTA